MSSLFDTLTQQLGGDAVQQISRQVGADPATTQKALPAALGSLMGALAGNSARGEGAQALTNALARDHDGSILDNLSGYLSNPQAGPGEGILRHALGRKQAAVEVGLSQNTGLDAGSARQLLTVLAPIVMGALGRTQRQKGLDAGAVASLLQGERQEIARKAPEGLGLVGQLLDRDGDGQIMDDVAKIGGGLLKDFLGRRR